MKVKSSLIAIVRSIQKRITGELGPFHVSAEFIIPFDVFPPFLDDGLIDKKAEAE